MVAVPWDTAFNNPGALTVTTPGADDVQVANDATFCVVPSLYVPMAEICFVVPSGNGPASVIDRPRKVTEGAGVLGVPVDPPPPQAVNAQTTRNMKPTAQGPEEVRRMMIMSVNSLP